MRRRILSEVYVSEVTIVRLDGPVRRATLAGFEEPVFYGVHSEISSFYGVEPKVEYPATLDHLVGAVAG